MTRLSRIDAITIRAGARARAHLAREGLQAGDIAAIPAAAGGPKGLALIPLDKLLFGQWLGQSRVVLAGASIGAWRMAAAAQTDSVAALDRLAEAYLAQRYPARPSARQVSDQCQQIVRQVLGASPEWQPTRQLTVVTTRTRGLLAQRYSKARFGAAALANLGSRVRLGHFFERVIFSSDDASHLDPRDRFGAVQVPLHAANLSEALLASGTIPLLAEPVRDIDAAPRGLYWDGGMVDYHLAWPWNRLEQLVLYPHFVDHIVPGWLDKSLPWRRASGAALDNVILIAPSPAFLRTLPLGKLPDRRDFYRFGADHDARVASWRRALSECERLAEAFLEFCQRPDLARVRPL